MNNFKCPCCHKIFAAQQGGNTIIFCPHCNAVVMLPGDELLPGEIVGGFQIIKLLGKGGMGNVYLSKQTSMQRLVALKLISKTLVKDPTIIDQFRNEVQVSGRLNHPNIITAFDAGETEKFYFLAVTYIDGEDFEKRMDREFVIPEKEAFEIAVKVAEALSYAWEKHKLMHKDIKPGNLMRDKKGEIFIMDMGIAQKLGSGVSSEEYILGSPFYISPEQSQGSMLDWRCDLYSLGATLYHMIVGVPPYDAQDVMNIIKKHIHEPFPDPMKANPNAKISRPAIQMLKRMMAKKPEDRFDSWVDFIKTARNYQSYKAPAAAPSRHDASVTPSGRNPSYREKKRPVPRASGRSEIIKPAKPPTSPLVQLINYGLLIVSAIIVAVLIRGYMKSSQAYERLKAAEAYSIRNPTEIKTIIRLYGEAREVAIGTKYEKDAIDKYTWATDLEARMNSENAAFDIKFSEALELYKKKDYPKAMEIFTAIKGINEPFRRQKVNAMINQILTLTKGSAN